MICSNGEQRMPQGETGIFFFCNLKENEGNVCKFVKWCTKTNRYEASTDKNGASCPHFYTDTLDLMR